MRSFNKVIVIGNLIRDPELRYTPKGKAVAQVCMAVNRVWNDSQTGEKMEEVLFVDVTTFNRLAENFANYCAKGAPIFVEGRLRLESCEDKQTHQKRSKLSIVAQTIQFLGGKPEESRDGMIVKPAPPAMAAAKKDEDDCPL